MEEVKHLFKTRQYKKCSARCIRLLEETKDPTREHPLFMTWTAFYAATSLEETSRSLNMNSSNKVPILEQAVYYYEKAKTYLDLVPDVFPIVTQNTQQRSSSVSSSITPTDSPFSPSEATSSSSPTFPYPTDSGPGNEKDEKFNITVPPSNQSLEAVSATPSSPVIPPYYLALSAKRTRTQRHNVEAQLDYHINFANEQLTVLRIAQCSNRSNMFSAHSARGIDGVDMEKKKKAELKARAERLREEGWKRERFDGEKYQTLCDKALAELD